MNGYIFKILTADNHICYIEISASNVAKARKVFAETMLTYSTGWCLLGVYRLIH